MKQFALYLLLAVAAIGARAQEMSVASMTQNTMDLSAATHPRADLNGVPCALVKVLMPEGGGFEGNIIEPVEFRMGEYWVYVTAGTRQIRVKHPSAKPVQVVFADYGIPRLESKMTYTLDMNMPATRHSAASAHTYLVLTVSPADAKVTLDGQMQELQDGTLRMLVRRNTVHDYLVEAPGCLPEQGTVSIGTEKVERSIALRSRKGTLAVATTTPGTEIYINGEKTATGSWRGDVVPGDYLVEGRLAGYVPAEQLATVATGAQQSVTIPALEAITGSLNVDYRPDGAAITVDGAPRGTTPNVLDGLGVGTHRVTISADGYEPATRDVTIRDSELTTLSGSLERASAQAPQATPTPQSATQFSTTPVHLALCATGPDGRAVYITAEQWLALNGSVRSAYTPLGVCLIDANDTFLVELHDKERREGVTWNDALKYNLPTKEQGEILVKNKETLNNVLQTLGGTMTYRYWTKTGNSISTAWTFHMFSGTIDLEYKTSNFWVRAVAPAPSTTLQSSNVPSRSSTQFSTTPVHLALCATGPDGRAVYITAEQWRALSVSARAAYKPLGVCLVDANDTFLVELNDKKGGKGMEWKKALKYNLPTKDQGQILINNKKELYESLHTFGGIIMNGLYWTKTERNSSTAWDVSMTYSRMAAISKTVTGRVRAVAPAPAGN